MWYIILSLVIVVAISVIAYSHWHGIWLEVVILDVIVVILFVIFALFALVMTTGLVEQYSSGELEGYITKISYKGILWKTNEGEMQVGTGNIAVLQTPFEFSIVEKEILDKVHRNIGKKVRVKYRQWFVMPYRLGSSGYELVEVEELEKKVEK